MANVHDIASFSLAVAKRSAARAEAPVAFIAQWLTWDVGAADALHASAAPSRQATERRVKLIAPWLLEEEHTRLAA